jgi:hypothetical protein
MRISTIQVSSVILRSKKLEIRKKMKTVKEPSDGNQTECHEIEPNPSKDRAMHEGDNPSFWDEFIKFTFFFLTVQFIFVSRFRLILSIIKPSFGHTDASILTVLSIELIFLDFHCVITRTGSSDNVNNARCDKLSDDPVRVMTQWKSKNINSILVFTLWKSFLIKYFFTIHCIIILWFNLIGV